jgi:peptide/nickel transport system substrate-binding protein
VGTGPYKLDKYDEANKTVTLVRNEDYAGDKAKTAKIVFKIIPDEATRRQELQAGSIDGYDLPEPGRLEGPGGRRLQRRGPPGLQHPLHGPEPDEEPEAEGPQGPPGLYYALNRDQLVKTQLPEGAAVATQFMPDTVSGYNKDLSPTPMTSRRPRACSRRPAPRA